MVSRYRETDDIGFLKVLLRGPLHPDLDRAQIFAAFDDPEDRYWAARVAEAALRADPSLAASLAFENPHAFTWAAGRLGRPELVPLIMQAIERGKR